MKIVKVVYNNSTEDTLNVFQDFPRNIILETFNYDLYKERKKAIPIMTRYGTKQFPLIVFADENQEEYAAIWKENNVDITQKLILQYL